MDINMTFPPPEFNLLLAAIWQILGLIPGEPVLYLAAALVARLAHRHIWLVYLALAIVTGLRSQILPW